MANILLSVDDSIFKCPITHQYFNKPVLYDGFFIEESVLLLVSNIFGISVNDILLNYINYFIKYIII